MSLKARLKKLESLIAQRSPARAAGDKSDEDWLATFEAWGQEGRFAHEPDFAVALATYRDALRQAKAQTDRPFDPPDNFQAELPEHLRLLNWRTPFKEVRAAWNWLAGMALRGFRGIPPVTEIEFGELAAWFSANESRLFALSLPSYLLDVGAGRRETVTNLRCRLGEGPRALHAGEVARDVRELRARYGGDS